MKININAGWLAKLKPKKKKSTQLIGWKVDKQKEDDDYEASNFDVARLIMNIFPLLIVLIVGWFMLTTISDVMKDTSTNTTLLNTTSEFTTAFSSSLSWMPSIFIMLFIGGMFFIGLRILNMFRGSCGLI